MKSNYSFSISSYLMFAGISSLLGLREKTACEQVGVRLKRLHFGEGEGKTMCVVGVWGQGLACCLRNTCDFPHGLPMLCMAVWHNGYYWCLWVKSYKGKQTKYKVNTLS